MMPMHIKSADRTQRESAASVLRGAIGENAARLDALHGRSDGGRGAVRLTRCTEVRRRTRAVSDLS